MKLEDLAVDAIKAEWLDLEVYADESKRFQNAVADGESISEAFMRFGEEEKVHLAALQDVFPAAAKKVKAPGARPRHESLRDALKEHIERELGSVRRYEEMLTSKLSPLDSLLVKGILSDEKEHLRMLLYYLKSEF
ncbi:MAG: hypothetical protein HY924_12705 [Elusimicrobia bacterium]|nr:hypothetical protein [Elusimicrobiota bacterium]